MDAETFLRSDRAHDVPHLLARWRRLARSLRLTPEILCRAGGYDVITLEKRGELPGIYVSAGIHGDEAGATEGFFRWAARGGLEELLARDIPFFLAPVLNPWGIANNRRHNADGIDLNRQFLTRSISPIPELRARVKNTTRRASIFTRCAGRPRIGASGSRRRWRASSRRTCVRASKAVPPGSE
jgi:hypothetical protein